MATTGKGLSPAVGSVLFILFIPGTVVVLIPRLLSSWQVQPLSRELVWVRWFGAAMIAIGLPLLGAAVRRFVRQGRGTPAPWMPTEQLVITGLYRYVRNPMYLGVVAMIAGQGLLFGSVPVLGYATVVACCFVLFVLFYEEPVLRRRYGPHYDDYCRHVPRWLPRLTPWKP